MRRRYRRKPQKYIKNISVEDFAEDLQRDMIRMWHTFKLNNYLNAIRKRRGWKKLLGNLL